MIRVVLADDEALIRVGIRTILSADPDIDVVGEAGTGNETIDVVSRVRPDVALVDIRMPDVDGLAAIPRIRRMSPGTAIAMLTTFGKDTYISRALGEGANGFLLKAGDPRELLAGVRAVAGGGAYLSPKAAEHVASRFREAADAPHKEAAVQRIGVLSPREREVLGLLGAGLSNAEIAQRLNLVEDTVKTHVSGIFTRLGVRNRVQAAILAYETGLTNG